MIFKLLFCLVTIFRWALFWENIFELTAPYANVTSIDVTANMKNLNWNASHMFHVADEFFESIGLIPLPHSFWVKSMIVKPDRPAVCHASAWDFYNG